MAGKDQPCMAGPSLLLPGVIEACITFFLSNVPVSPLCHLCDWRPVSRFCRTWLGVGRRVTNAGILCKFFTVAAPPVLCFVFPDCPCRAITRVPPVAGFLVYPFLGSVLREAIGTCPHDDAVASLQCTLERRRVAVCFAKR